MRAWHAGLRPAVRSPRAREKLTELVPPLLASFAKGSDPDAAVAGFDRALERLPTATELFAILTASAALRTLFGEILGGAPRLAEAVATHPHLLDIAIDGGAEITFDEDAMEARIVSALARATTTEEVLDLARDYQHEEHFLIGTRLLSGALAPREAGLAYTALAVGTIRALLARAEAAFAAEHGRIPGLTLAVLGFGRLGSREMTASSDLDLVLVYDAPANATSEGARPLDASTWVARLTQRLVTALTAPTRRGRLYDVDMRLRPSGRQGPLATKFSAFAAYQKTTAATWEHLALVRARVVAGDAGLARRLEAAIAEALGAPRATLHADVAAMRALMARERPPSGVWDLKLAPGGLVDAEFTAQTLALAHPALRDPAPRVVLERAAAQKPRRGGHGGGLRPAGRSRPDRQARPARRRDARLRRARPQGPPRPGLRLRQLGRAEAGAGRRPRDAAGVFRGRDRYARRRGTLRTVRARIHRCEFRRPSASTMTPVMLVRRGRCSATSGADGRPRRGGKPPPRGDNPARSDKRKALGALDDFRADYEAAPARDPALEKAIAGKARLDG